MKGVEARRNKRIEKASELEVVGKMVTSGTFGDHVIELMVDNGLDDPVVWMRVDGELRRPRTARGIHKVVSEWIFHKSA